MTRGVNTNLYTQDEAIEAIVESIDAYVRVLRRRHDTRSIDRLLRQRHTRQPLTIAEQRARSRYAEALKPIRRCGHGDLIGDQVEGYVSALEVDPCFASPAARAHLPANSYHLSA
jgi:hypothetical protein